ncbi:hypothetical protein TRFO_30633 [Tritrichomonas foetus]|uniref:Uncharacterized protein n=1 Tax=Tritrichomonas foetus TaxID=1144522 RepID=A0A1J4JXL2_9EUKA|nr:hypothetical protein TRFO_30633 [Tritrichomonas foetus]|eukprot:OHT02270.1 hypothetical protein TRFO_30633 [Tritrichomonas foetus]
MASHIKEILDLALDDPMMYNSYPSMNQQTNLFHGENSPYISAIETVSYCNTESFANTQQQTDSQDTLSKKAFILLANGPIILIDALLENYTFLLKATELLSRPSIPTFLASRLATIFSNICLKSEENSINSIGLMVLLLKYIEDSAVFDLFHTICSKKNKLKKMQFAIAQTDIDVFILNELIAYDATIEKKHNLCLMIQDCLKNSRLTHKFTNVRVLQALVNLMNTSNTQLLNQVWQTISLMVCQKLVTKMQCIYNRALEILIEPFDTLHIYHTSIFEFLAKVVQLRTSFFTETHKSQICQIILRLFVQFPNSTNLMTAMFRFIRNSLFNKEFAHKVLNSFIVLFVIESQSEARTAASASALLFLGDLERMKTSSIMINKFLTGNAQYMHFCKTFFKNYLEELPIPYGGTTITRYVKREKNADAKDVKK